MRQFFYTSIEEFSNDFVEASVAKVDSIVESISNALKIKDDIAETFEVIIENHPESYQIYLPKAQWRDSLSFSMEYYRKNNLEEKSLEAYDLLKQLEREPIQYDPITELSIHPN